jgi:membrane protease YdiL (CAAX protease family)
MVQSIRFAQAGVFILTWMGLGWILHLDPNAYLLLGIPLAVLFQLFVCRKPLRNAWVRGAPKFRLDTLGIVLAIAFAVYPAWQLAKEWPLANWSLRLWFVACLIGAVGVGFALRHFTKSTLRDLLLCLAIAGGIGCAWMLLTAVAQHRDLSFTGTRVLTTAGHFLLYLPVCFVIEEVVFRGVLDSHIHHPGDPHPWFSALLLSAMWGWWHLPVAPPFFLLLGLIFFPITHAIVGAPLAIFWRRSGNLLVPATAHALIDALRDTLLY